MAEQSKVFVSLACSTTNVFHSVGLGVTAEAAEAQRDQQLKKVFDKWFAIESEEGDTYKSWLKTYWYLISPKPHDVALS